MLQHEVKQSRSLHLALFNSNQQNSGLNLSFPRDSTIVERLCNITLTLGQWKLLCKRALLHTSPA